MQEMEFMIRGRATGKTTELLKRFFEDPEHTVVVTWNQERATRLARQACDQAAQFGAEVEYFAIREHFVSARSTPTQGWVGRTLVDDLDLVLPILLRGPVPFVTATGITV